MRQTCMPVGEREEAGVTQPTPVRPDYDQALKAMLSRAPDGFLSLIAPALTWRGELSPELPASSRQADLVWDVEAAGGERGVLHIELQTKIEEDIGKRLAEYSLRLYDREQRPVYSIVVFLRRAIKIPQSPFVIRYQGQERLRFVFDVIRLWELPQESVIETPYYDLWPLAGLMADVSVETTLAVAERIAAAPLPRHERSELTGLLTLLAGMRLSRVTLLEAIGRNGMIKDIWEESSFADAAYDIFHDRLIAEGEAKGEAKGEATATREMARLALEGRYGALSDDLVTALASADPAACRAIVAHLTTDTLEQVRERLELTAPGAGGETGGESNGAE
jgi:hypothetical protein